MDYRFDNNDKIFISRIEKKEGKKSDVKAEETTPSEQKPTPAADESIDEDKSKIDLNTDKETPTDDAVIQDEVMDLDDKE